MAQQNPVYDPEADKDPSHKRLPEHDRPGHDRAAGYSGGNPDHDPQKTPLGDPTVPTGDLKQAEEGGGFYNAGGDGGSAAAEQTGSLRDMEAEGGGSSSGNRQPGSLYNPNDSTAGGRLGNLRSRAGSLSKNKLLLGALFGGSAGIVILFILFILFLGSLKIPNLAQHITEYQFARVLRQSVETEGKITNEKLAVDSLGDTNYGKVKAKYQGLRDDTWGKLDKYRPEKVLQQMKDDSKIQLNYSKTGVLGRQKLTSVTLNSAEYTVKDQGFVKYVPGISSAVDFKGKVSYSRDFAPALEHSLKADQIGPIVRSQVSKKIRQELGIGLIAWNVGKYQGKSAEKARLQQERDSYKAEKDPKVAPSTTPQIDEAENAGQDAETAAVADDKQLQSAINNNGVITESMDAIDSKLTPNTFDKAVGLANPAFAIALAGCTIYDGSLTQSGPTINSQTESQERAYYYLNAAADQQKYGETTGEAVGAFNDKLGDTSQSNPEIRANGGTVDTSEVLSSEASSGGDFSIVDAALGGTVGKIVNSFSEPTCKTLLDPTVAVGGAILGLLAGIFTGGATGAAEGAVDAAVDTTVSSLTKRLVENIVTRLADKEALKTAANAKLQAIFTKQTFKDGVKSTVVVGGLTALAKLITVSKMNGFNNGLEQQTDYANAADSGGSILASQTEQRQFYGRPLTATESGEDKSADLAFLSEQTSREPAYERYASLTNPDSLLTRSVTKTASLMQGSDGTTFLSLVSKLFSPLSSLQSLFGSALMPRTLAAATYSSSKDDYGNVRFGYSAEEMKILRTDFTYRPLENRSVLDDSDKENDIESKYGQCFDGSKEIGDMLADGLIVRDKNGNIDPDNGDCAPNKLSYDNTEFDTGDDTHLVFRWRVANNYSNGLDQLNDKQEVTADASTGTNTSSSTGGDGSLPTGSSKDLATQLLPYVSQGKISCNGGEGSDCSDIQNTAKGNSIKGGQGCQVDALQPALLGMLLELVKMGHTFVLSALCSDHHNDGLGGHAGGRAADFNYIDKVFMGPNDSPWTGSKLTAGKKLDQDAASFMPKSTGFGQIQCHANFSFLSGFKTFNDACHHQHIQVAG